MRTVLTDVVYALYDMRRQDIEWIHKKTVTRVCWHISVLGRMFTVGQSKCTLEVCEKHAGSSYI